MTTLEMDFRRSKYAAKLAQTVSLSLIDPAGFDLSAVSVGYLEGETWDHHESSSGAELFLHGNGHTC